MDVFLCNKPLIGSQAIGFYEYERQRRKQSIHHSEDRSIFLWLAGDRVTAYDSPKGVESAQTVIRVGLNPNVFRINELPEIWQTPSHKISIYSESHMPHGLEPVLDAVVRLEDQGINCLVCGGASNSIVPVGIDYASPDIISSINQKGFNLPKRHSWFLTPEQFGEQLRYAHKVVGEIHRKYGINDRDIGRLNTIPNLPPIFL